MLFILNILQMCNIWQHNINNIHRQHLRKKSWQTLKQFPLASIIPIYTFHLSTYPIKEICKNIQQFYVGKVSFKWRVVEKIKESLENI